MLKQTAEKSKYSLFRAFPFIKSINFGIFLVCTHIFLDLGAFQQILDFVVPLRIPVITSAMSVVYALFFILTGQFSPFKSKLSRSYTALVLFISFYALIITINKEARSDGIKLFFVYYANYIILCSCVKNIFQLSLIIDSYLLAVLHSCYHGIRQGGMIWSSKWLGDENEISILVVCAIPFAFMLLLLYRNKIRKILYSFAIAVFVSMIVVANSRGGAVALFLTGFLCWSFIEKKLRALFFISIVTISILSFAPQKWFSELKSIKQGTEESTAFDRSYGWKLAVKMFQDYPFSGVGIFNYPEYYVPYNLRFRIMTDRHPNRNPHIKRVAHSTPIEWLAETGIIGSLFFSFVLLALHSNWKSVRSSCKNIHTESADYLKAHNTATAIALIGFWAGAFFVSILIWPFFWILLPFSEICRKLADRKEIV